MSMKYLDFDLHIWREGDRYAVEVTDSPAGQSNREFVSWPFAESEHDLLQRLEAMVRKSGPRTSAIPSPVEAYLREFGSDIFKAVFRNADSVSSTYGKSLHGLPKDTGLRINLRIEPPEWANLPWEYVFDERSYLCLHTDSPVVRRLSAARTRQAVDVHTPVRVLAMLVNLSGEWSLPDAENERRRLETIMQDVEFTWVPRATPDCLIDFMQEGPWDIFHFIGHGGTDQATDIQGNAHSLGYLVMDDGVGQATKLWADRLAIILGSGNIKLAVINCCDSARGHSTSVGAALVAEGIPMAIAMQFGISDASAARFSERFYKSLTGGETAECALTFARQSMQLASDAEWAIPIMYTQAAPCVFFSNGKPATHALRDAVAAGPAAATPVAAAPVAAAPVDSARAQAQAELRRLWKSA